ISLMNLGIIIEEGRIILDGLVADKGALTCSFDNVDISLANLFLEEKNINLQGIINNDIILRNITNGLTFTSNLKIDDLTINEAPVGNAWLNVGNTFSPDVFNTNIKLLYNMEGKEYLPLQIIGTITPQGEQEQMNLDISMEQFDLGIIESFVSSFASDLEGGVSCKDLKVRGRFSSPEIEGKIHTENAAMRINMLGTKYYFTDDIEVDRNKLSFENFILRDVQNNKITINGNVAHNDFSTFDMDLKVVADKIKILDTKEESEQMYYGTAYASAVVFIKGDSTMIDISGTAKTEPGTSLTVPVSNKASMEENNFIVFYSQMDSNQIQKTI
ncbi:MAG: translocation/assembly module TamB domain-containing protein, partial [Bacteroidota bacterium]|nr:translocation/assembly module TamB domain-containing protein [Bacteroidota bacterium]